MDIINILFGTYIVLTVVIIIIIVNKFDIKNDQKKDEADQETLKHVVCGETKRSEAVEATQDEIRAAAAKLMDACSLEKVASGEFPSIKIMNIGAALANKHGKGILKEVIELIDFIPARELIITVWKSIGLI